MKKKVLLSSVLSIVLCLSLICGATFALFTDTDQVDIAVTAGNVAVTAEVQNIKLYSRDVDQTAAGKFATGGTATLDQTSNTLTLDKIVPGDKITFDIKVTNKSNVDILYRTILDLYEGAKLYETLEIKINDEDFEQNVSGKRICVHRVPLSERGSERVSGPHHQDPLCC